MQDGFYFEICAFNNRHNMPESLFGRMAVKDPRLVSDIRKGRALRESTIKKVRAFMQERDAMAANETLEAL
jgi:hypothetical protein